MADEMAEEVLKVIESLQQVESMKDPIAQAAAISEVLKYVEKHGPDWRDKRRKVVLQLRAEEVPYRKIAALIRTSLGTVQSLERGHAGAWGTKPRKKPTEEGVSDESAGGAER